MMIRLVIIVALIVQAFHLPFVAYAAPLTDVTWRMSNTATGAYANHTVAFRIVSAISSGSISLDFSPVISNTNSLTHTDVDLMYAGTQLSLGATAGVGVWGVSVSSTNKSVSLSYPASGGTAIPAGSVVIVKIGSHTTYQVAGSKQFVNATTIGQKTLSISTLNDSATSSKTLATTTNVNKQMINRSVPGSYIVPITAGTDTGRVAVPLVTEDSVGVTGQVGGRGAVVGGIFAPSNLNAVANMDGSVDLGWVDNSSIESGFILERKYGSENFAEIADLSANTKSYHDTSFTRDGTYSYRVRSYNSQFLSEYSNTITVSRAVPNVPSVIITPSQPAPTTTAPTQEPTIVVLEAPVPASISNLRGTAGDQTADLTWNNPSDPDLLFIQIQWSDETFPLSASDGVTIFKDLASHFTDRGLVNGAPSFYTVFAVNKYGKYSAGAYVSVTPEGPVRALRAPAVSTPPPQSASEVVTAPQPTKEAVQEAALSPVTILLTDRVAQTYDARQAATLSSTQTYDTGGVASTFMVRIGEQTIPQPYELSITPRSFEQLRAIDQSVGWYKDEAFGGSYYQVQLISEDQSMKQFTRPIALEFTYDEKLARYVDESSLKAHYWNTLSHTWVPIPSIVDTANRVVTATTSHFTIFTLKGTPSEKARQLKAPYRAIAKASLPAPAPQPNITSELLELRTASFMVRGDTIEMYAGDDMSLCIADKFPVPVSSLTLTHPAGTYVLQKGSADGCYQVTAPAIDVPGTYSLTFVTMYADDRSHIDQLKLVVRERSAETAVQRQSSETPWLYWVVLVFIGLFATIGCSFILHKIVRRYLDE